MFTRLRLIQFKAWRDTKDVDVRPVTMLLGANSSGKSSLIQSLLLLKQTAMSPDRTIHLNLGGDELRDYFNFGDFSDVLTQNVAKREFTIAVDFEAKVPSRVTKGQLQVNYGQASSGATVIRDLLLKTDTVKFRSVRREKGAYSLFVDEEPQPRGKGRDLAPERSIALPAQAISILVDKGPLAEDLSLAVRRELEGIVYLGPLRRKPERDYVWNKSVPGEIGSDGDRAIDVLLSSSQSRNAESNGIIEGVSKWLKRMGVAEKIEVRQTSRTRYEVRVEREGINANLRDVGIGISQVLPVLTVAYFASPGTTIILEEPEIHLHPLAQSVLAELFVEVSHERQVQFIVETHSEHLFRRMQTLIAKRITTPDECAMYFVVQGEGGASLTRLHVDEFGVVKNWPKNFFGDSAGEAREQAKARAQRPDGSAGG